MVVVLRHGYGMEASDVIAQGGKKTTRVLVGQHSQNKMDFLSRCKVGMKMLAKRFTSGRIMPAIKPDLSIGNEVSQGARFKPLEARWPMGTKGSGLDRRSEEGRVGKEGVSK